MVTLVAAGFFVLEATKKHDDDRGLSAYVTRVVDGDTIQVKIGQREETVRYIGVDTPESVKPGAPVQCYAKAASHFNERLVESHKVKLVLGDQQRDRYNRLLAYVYLTNDSQLVNRTLIERGYARVLSIAPNTRFADLFTRLQSTARSKRLGLWQSCR